MKLLSLSLSCGALTAQVGGKPAVADLIGPPNAAVIQQPTSAWLNAPNAYWDKGEAFWNPEVPDIGGVLSRDDNPAGAAGATYLRELRPWTPITTMASSSLHNWVGEIRGDPDGEPNSRVASLEIVSPTAPTLQHHERAIVVITIEGTFPPLEQVHEAPYNYPGDSNNLGLLTQVTGGVWSHYRWPPSDQVVEHFRTGTQDYDVFGAYIVPRTSHRPLLFWVQRVRQLREVVLKKLTEPDGFGYNAANVGFVVAGGSLGGLPSQILVLLYPNNIYPNTTPGQSSHTDLLDAVYQLVDDARQQIGVVVPPPVQGVPLSSGLATLNPSEHVLARDPDGASGQGWPTRTAPASVMPNLLTPDPTFQSYGDGTFLGVDESLVVGPPAGTGAESVWVGSAEGIVTRFVQQDIDLGGGQVMEALVRAATSNAAGQPFTQGWGVFGLALGDVDPGSDGNEIVAASYQRLAVYDAATLTLIRTVAAPFSGGPAEAWLYSRPRHLAVAELDAATPGEEIVLTTRQGLLLILDGQLNVIASHSEGGIVDLVTGLAVDMRLGGTSIQQPIFALTSRGSIVSLEFDTSRPALDQAMLSAASSLQYGATTDLELILWQGCHGSRCWPPTSSRAPSRRP